MHTLTKNIRKVIHANDLIQDGEKLVLAVSGGADSMALLHLFADLQQSMRLKLHVATLNHGLRAEAEEEVALVAGAASRLSLPFTSAKVDVPQVANERGVGLEAAAREARYKFLAGVAQEIGASKVVTAHHADDQVETILMHLLRGAGLGGLTGMSFRTRFSNDLSTPIEVIRPLLSVSGKVLEDYCNAHQITYVDDQTNLDTTFMRNRIRHEVLPYLRTTVNPNVDKALVRLAEISSVDHAYLEQVTDQYLSEISVQEDQVSIDRSWFQTLHQALQRRLIVHVLHSYFPAATVKLDHVLHAVALAADGEIGAIAEFTDGIHMRVDYKAINFTSPQQVVLPTEQYLLPARSQPITLRIPGKTAVPEMGWSVIAQNGSSSTDSLNQNEVSIPYDAAPHLVLRPRVAGDRFQPNGMNGHSQKVSDWMINRKVPRQFRERVPLLATEARIYAILWNQQWFPAIQSGNDNDKSILFRVF